MAEAYTTYDGNIGNRVYTPTDRPSKYPPGILRDLGVTENQMEQIDQEVEAEDLPQMTKDIMIREARQRFFDSKFLQWQGDTKKINGHLAGNLYVLEGEGTGKIKTICVQTFRRYDRDVNALLSRWYTWRNRPDRRLVNPVTDSAALIQSPLGRSVLGHMIVAVLGKKGSAWQAILDTGHHYDVIIKDLDPVTDVTIDGRYI